MRKLHFFAAIILLVFFSSCRVLRPSLMFKTPKDYNFDKFSDTMAVEEYRIAPDDAISFRVFSNEGFKLIDLTSTTTNVVNLQTIEGVVAIDGTLKVPLLGRVKVAGLSLRQAEQLLESKYNEFYVGPYVMLKVTNKRAFVFPGTGGTAKVVPVIYNNTTIFEALAQAGGITEEGKAYRVKLIRNNFGKKPLVYQMDLSTIDGVKQGNTIIQANDIIYVEPRPKVVQKFAQEISPYITILTSFILVYTLFKR